MNKIQTATYYLGAWFCLTIGLLLTACSDDDATDRRESNRTIQLSAGARQFQLIDDLSAAPGITRGVLYPDQTNENDETAWKKFEPTDQPNILLFVAKGKDNPTSSDVMSRLFAFSATKKDWQANITIIDTDPKYYIYGFMPIDAQNTSDNVNIGLLPSATNYNAGAQLSINGLKVLTDKDPCVIVGVAKPNELDNNTLQWGKFQWGTFEFQFKPNGEKVTDYMGILLDHIYSQYHFKLKIDADYAKLRTIRITGITLEALDIYGYTVSSVDATVTLNKTTGSNPLSTPTFKYNRGTRKYPLYTKPDNSDGQKLTTSYADFGFCLAPCSQRWFCLTTSYDVLDTKETVIRQDEVVNNFDVRALIGNDITNTDPGLMHTIQITVNPTYLHMLSDPDLDNPKLTIN